MRPTPYPELNTVLEQLVHGIRGTLGDSLVGAYLQGSFAVGDFDRHSDADFVVAVREELSAEQVERLGQLHRDIYDVPVAWARHIEGSYFPLEILRRGERSGVPLWYLDHGSNALVRSNHCNTLVVRSVLRDRGITLDGPPASELVDPVSVSALRQEIARTMTEWARDILNDPGPYRNRFYQGYIVLSYARMLHDLTTGRPGSKRAGAEWAKKTFDVEWQDLVDRAWETRPDPATSVRQPPDAESFDRSLEFMRMCVRESTAFRIRPDV